jgi:hypothetical protein
VIRTARVARLRAFEEEVPMRSNRGWGITLLFLAFVLLAGGLLARFVVYPSQLRFPADVDVTRNYEGALSVMMNPAAVATGDLANLFMRDVPVTLSRTVETLEVGGDDGAIVQETAAMSGPAGVIMATVDVYSIDRSSMEAITNFSDDARVIDRDGLVIGWPIGTDKQDYVGWNGDTLEPVALAYAGEEARGGIDTYRFEATSDPGLIVDPEILGTLPVTLPKALLADVAATIGLSDEQAAQLAQLLQVLPDDVPIAYTYAFEKSYWVEPATGVLVDVDVSETRAAAIQVPDGTIVPLTEIQQLDYTSTATSVQEAIDDANGAMFGIRLLGQLIPGVAILLGVVVAWFGFRLFRRPEEVAFDVPARERESLSV